MRKRDQFQLKNREETQGMEGRDRDEIIASQGNRSFQASTLECTILEG